MDGSQKRIPLQGIKCIGGGSIIGATLGSLILPGAGTLVGVVVGVAIGNLYFSKQDKTTSDDKERSLND